MTKSESNKQSVSNIVNNLKDMTNEGETSRLIIYHDGSYIVEKYNEDNNDHYIIVSIGDRIQELAELAKR